MRKHWKFDWFSFGVVASFTTIVAYYVAPYLFPLTMSAVGVRSVWSAVVGLGLGVYLACSHEK